MTIRVGILQTDRVMDQFQDAHGDYPEMFGRLFERVDPEVQTVNFWVQDERQLPAEPDCDAYVITGSRHSVYDDLPWIQSLVGFLERVLEANRKVVGVCFGHQLMAHHFGGRVAPASGGWAVGVHESNVVDAPPWMSDEDPRRFALISSHKDQVIELPSGARVYASNDFCPVAGFTVGHQVFTIQGHPEFEKRYSRDLMDMRRDTLGEPVYREGVASLEEQTDEQLLAEWMVRFMRGEAIG
jgi:GMP synthase-like glutamine amidotransferase